MSDETTLAATPGDTTAAAAPEADLTTKIETPGADTPEPKPKPEAAETVDVIEKPEGETDDGDTEGKKRVPGSQRLKNRLKLIEADYLSQQEELNTLRRERAAPKADGKPGIDREPTEADFPSDYLAFERAKIGWDVRQSVRQEMQGLIKQDRSQKTEQIQAEHRRETLLAYEESKETARERIADFDKVVSTASNVTIKDELASEILSSEKSALLQYHLAKNPEKARELNALSGRELAREIGRLEARIHLPTAKKATDATTPPSQVKGGSSPPVDPATGPDDMNAYVAWRKKSGFGAK